MANPPVSARTPSIPARLVAAGDGSFHSAERRRLGRPQDLVATTSWCASISRSTRAQLVTPDSGSPIVRPRRGAPIGRCRTTSSGVGPAGRLESSLRPSLLHVPARAASPSTSRSGPSALGLAAASVVLADPQELAGGLDQLDGLADEPADGLLDGLADALDELGDRLAEVVRVRAGSPAGRWRRGWRGRGRPRRVGRPRRASRGRWRRPTR